MTSEAANLRYPYPIEDPEVLTMQARTVSNLGALLLDTHAEVNDDNLKLTKSWRSDTAVKAVSDVQNLSSAMHGDSTSLADAAAAITSYVGHVNEARTDIDGIRKRYDDANAQRIHDNQHPPEWVDHRFEHEEWRESTQYAFDQKAIALDGERDTVLATLRTRSNPAVAALDTTLERFVGANPPTSQSLGEVAFERASQNLDLTGGRYEFQLRQAGLLSGASPDGYYAEWLENAERQGVEPGVLVQIAEQQGITPEDFEILEGLEEVTDPDGKSYFILPEHYSGSDARKAVLMTYILNAGTDYGDTADVNDYPETPYSAAEVQRIVERQEKNKWSYDDYVSADDDDTGLLATTPNGILMGIGGKGAHQGGTTYGDLFLINVDTEDPDVLRNAIRNGEAIYQFDDGSIGRSTEHLDLDRLLHHEEIHSQQWAAEGITEFMVNYASEASLEWLGIIDHNSYEEDAGLSDGGYHE
jgi:hypothetical protein